jgi:hypothetical protein
MEPLEASISFDCAMTILARRGVSSPHDRMLSALLTGTIVASGLIAPRLAETYWGTLPTVWWQHISGRIEDNVAFFNPAATGPPTPWRVELIEVPREAIDAIWPNRSRNESKPKASRRIGRPPGSGSYRRDPALVQMAIKMIEAGEARSVLNAAEKVANEAEGISQTAKIERLRRKIAKARSAEMR